MLEDMSREDFHMQMDTTSHTTKMCWNCDGHVGVEAHYCPYCGSDLYRDEQLESSPQKTLSSMYKPPYNPTQSALGVPSYADIEEPSYDEEYEADDVEYEPEEREVKKTSSDLGIWPLLFLSLGMNLMTIGLLLFFFSDGSKLTLEWNSHYWFIYCILSTPLLMFGWKLLRASAPSDEPS